MARVPAVLTSLTLDQVYRAFRRALESLAGQEVSREATCVLLAQSALETGRWQKMYNYNLGNIKSRMTDGHDYYMVTCSEVFSKATAASYLAKSVRGENGLQTVEELTVGNSDGRVSLRFNPPSPVCAFRAFDTFEAGVADHFAFLAQPRFAKAMAFALAGDVDGYIRELAAQRYFLASLTTYLTGTRSLFAEYLRKVPVDEPAAVQEPPLAITPFSLQTVSQDAINESFRGNREEG